MNDKDKQLNVVKEMDWYEYFTDKKNENPAIIILGKRGSGKSVLIRDIFQNPKWGLLKLRKYQLIIVISPTLKNGWYDFLCDSGIPGSKSYLRVFKSEDLDEKAIDFINKVKASNFNLIQSKQKPIKVCLIFDDYGSTTSRNNALVNSLFTNSRHWHATVFFIAQHLTQLSTSSRNNCDLMIFKTANQSKSVIRDQFIYPMFDARHFKLNITNLKVRQECNELMNKYTSLRRFMIVDNNADCGKGFKYFQANVYDANNRLVKNN